MITDATSSCRTVSVTPWIDKPTSIWVERPSSTTTFSFVKGAKPEAFTETVYNPGSRLMILKLPLSSVVALASLLVPVFLAVMVAPAITSLLGFETVPFIAPVTVDWAIALSAQIATSTKVAKQNRRVLHITGELLKEIKIVETKLRANRRAQTLPKNPRTFWIACSDEKTGNKRRWQFLS